MIRSIRYFLLISLLLSITVASAINGIGNYLLDEQVIQPYLDEQLLRATVLIGVLHQSLAKQPDSQQMIMKSLFKAKDEFGQSFLFQVWDKRGTLVMQSPHYPYIEFKNAPLGFSSKTINNDDWRIYSTYDDAVEFKLIVAELYNVRRDLADDIARSNANVLLVTYPIFGFLIWIIISLALQSITRVTTEIADRAPTYLEPVQLTKIPIEIKPLVAELNNLLTRLKLAFERNKRFAADAAHELRTPLAAIKTHAQVALKSDNDLDKHSALTKLIESVNRSSHVVAQLLTLSRLGAEETLSDLKPIDLHKLATEIITFLVPQALDKNIDIELVAAPTASIVLGNDTSLGILIRNVVDNAIRYTPPYGAVKITIANTITRVVLQVEDTGPGIPSELRERVFERFFRVLGTSAAGSGLGLAIVTQIAQLHHATIALNTPANGKGLQFEVAFIKYRA